MRKRLIGIWGYPDPKILNEIKAKYPNNEIIDLDICINVPSSNILPEAYCKIIKNLVDNAVYLKDNLDVIVASVGEEKCDSARFSASILKQLGFNIITTEYRIIPDSPIITPISQSDLPLEQKILSIMDGIIEHNDLNITETKPKFGFWGVPPNDMSFLEYFPNETHIYGWIRCVEAKRPADLELEMFVDENVPTVFFAQTFCAKMQLAKYLAKKYNGLYIDVDDVVSRSVRAKVEAFIKLG